VFLAIRYVAMQDMIRFVFFGRCDAEKGMQDIIDAVRLLEQCQLSNFHIAIYGDGFFADDLKTLAQTHETVIYHGRSQRDEIEQSLQQAHYNLMPSHFLETFGLTALESMTYGVPVVGYSKGNLINFVHQEHDISRYDGETGGEQLADCMKSLIVDHDQATRTEHSQQVKKTAVVYTPELFVENMTKLFGTLPRSILMVSDYASTTGGGGIETYLYKVKAVLEGYGCAVTIVGSSINPSNRLRKYL
jgi:glycosyltransferase involved in cell wall biosynthesis